MVGKRIGRYTVLVLSAYFLYEVERAAPEIGKIIRALQRRCWPVMAGKRCVEFVVLTEESSAELVERLRPVLDGITAISDYRCRFTFDDVVGKSGNLDILATYVHEAWQELRKRNSPDYVREPERSEPIVIGSIENFDRRTAIQMGIKARRVWKPTKDSDRKER